MSGLPEQINQTLKECDSTNRALADWIKQNPFSHGDWLGATSQSSGKGRGENKWISLEGNLAWSVVVGPIESSRLTWAPIASGVLIGTTLEGQGSKVSLKWPNDIYQNHKKAGGILCEAFRMDAGTFVVVGLGLNCQKAPEGTEVPAVSLGLDASALTENLVTNFRDNFFEVLNSISLKDEFLSRSEFRLGDTLTWMDGNQKHVGVFKGLGESGQLIVNEDGRETSIFSGDVRHLRRG